MSRPDTSASSEGTAAGLTRASALSARGWGESHRGRSARSAAASMRSRRPAPPASEVYTARGRSGVRAPPGVTSPDPTLLAIDDGGNRALRTGAGQQKATGQVVAEKMIPLCRAVKCRGGGLTWKVAAAWLHVDTRTTPCTACGLERAHGGGLADARTLPPTRGRAVPQSRRDAPLRRRRRGPSALIHVFLMER